MAQSKSNVYVDDAVCSGSLLGTLSHLVAVSDSDTVLLAVRAAVMSAFGSSAGFTTAGVPDDVCGFFSKDGVYLISFVLSEQGVEVIIHEKLSSSMVLMKHPSHHLINGFMDWISVVMRCVGVSR